MINKESFVKALQEIRKNEKEKGNERKFVQTVDLIINLKNFDIKRNSVNAFVNLPHSLGKKKIAAFLEKKSNIVDTITKNEFDSYKDKKKLKKIIKEYDFFIASAKLMPAVATSFGRVLGPAGKMPSPQLGVLMSESDDAVKALVKRIESVVRLRTKEPCIKVAVGKENESDENIAENCLAVYNEVYKNLPKQKENLRNILIKFTMSKPAKVAID
jgi:large subunit ribosomal protein L1